jgi:TolB-like protein
VRRLAVLEFERAPGVEVDRIYFSDRVRSLVSRQAPDLFVMTRESIEGLLQAAGTSAAECEDQCAIEVGRKLGADYVLSGRFALVGKSLSLSLRLHSTVDGRLVAARETVAPGVEQLGEGLEALGAALLKALSDADPLVALAGAGEVVVELVSEPGGAEALVDGAVRCRSTPCSASLRQGLHTISMRKAGHQSAALSLAVREARSVSLTLARREGSLSVASEPSGKPVLLDGKLAGVTPLELRGLLAVDHLLTLEDPCFEPVSQTVSPGEGGKQAVLLRLEPRVASLGVRSVDEAGAPVLAEVRVDGKRVGASPGTFSVPLCAQVVRVESGRAALEQPLRFGPNGADLSLLLPVGRCNRAATGNRLSGWGAVAGGALAAVGIGGAALMQSAVRSAAPGGSVDAKIAFGKGLNVAGLIGLAGVVAGGIGLLALPGTAEACSGVAQ